MRLCVLAAGCALVLAHGAVHAQESFIRGVFVASPDGPIELIAYAERTPHGYLRMDHGSLEDVPTVYELPGILTSLPQWKPTAMFVSTSKIFDDEKAERRTVPFAGRSRNIYTIDIRVVDLERRERIEPLLRAVRATREQPGYAFIVMAGGPGARYYPIRLTAGE